MDKNKTVADFFAASLLLCLIYRICFFIASYQNAPEPAAFRFAILSLGLMDDFLVCLALTAVILLLAVLFRFGIKFIAFVIFCLTALIYFINQKIFISLYIGLNYTLLSTYFKQGWSILNYLAFINWMDIIILSGTIISYFIITKTPVSILKKIILFILVPIFFIFSLYGASVLLTLNISHPGKRTVTMFTNPLHNIVYAYSKSFNQFNKSKFAMTANQQQSIELIDPSFLTTPPQKLMSTPSTHKQQWNIVIFVLESVGAWSDSHMPFLKSLAARSLWLENNYSGGNISPLGQFSIFTGIYPNPTPCHFEMQTDLNVRTLPRWLGEQYDSFFVSSSNNLYFATGINKTFSEFSDPDSMHAGSKNLYFNMFMDEHESFRFFFNRLNKAKGPFLGVYWSGATHYPYKNYSNKNLTNPHDRYLVSLTLLDQEIKETYELLAQKKLLDKTIFIVVGDHGEIFGQHNNTWVHGNSLFQEEIKVPLLIFNPKIFKPRMVKNITHSIDIVPTLLDVSGIHYGSKLQGESLLKQNFARKYVFVYGDQDDIAAIDQHNKKMIISFANDFCVAYDLKKDPHENQPLACTNQEQVNAILKFRSYQPVLLSILLRNETKYNNRHNS